MPRILVATRSGLHTFGDAGSAPEPAHPGRSVTALGRARDQWWAILDGAELWHGSADSWSLVTSLEEYQATCVVGIRDDVFVGSSEAHLFRLVGAALERVEAFDAAPGRDTWY